MFFANPHKYSIPLKLRWIEQCRMDFIQFSLNIQWNNNDHLYTRLVQTKFNTRTLDLYNHHPSFGSWSIARIRDNVSWLRWSNSRLQFSWSLSEILWQNHLLQHPRLNNPQDVGVGCLVVSFPVQWTRAHGTGSASKRHCTGVNGHAETGSCYSITR